VGDNFCVIIEDGKTQAKLIANMLAEKGWESNIAYNLTSGLGLIAMYRPKVVFVDLGLPDSEGCENVKKIKDAKSDTIVIAMSATDEINDEDSDLMQAKMVGAEFLLAKPFNKERLSSILEGLEYYMENGEHPPHILVIDDSKSIRTICYKILSEIGYRVTLAESMNDALDSVDLLDVDVILSDMNMPGIAPIDTIPKLRAKFPDVGIIVMSGNVDAKLFNTLARGADAIVVKPFEVEKLLEAIETAFARSGRFEFEE
jgi:two-component system chemotaxis response regulator CheY